jgi:hypothetical protein
MVGSVRPLRLAFKCTFLAGFVGALMAACGTQSANLEGPSPEGGVASSGSAAGGSGSLAVTSGSLGGGGSTAGSGVSNSGASAATGASSSGGGPGGGAGPLAGTGGCPIYNALCNGQCTVIAGDPTNCGACGNMCAAGRICSGGLCGGTCPPGGGETPCGGSCVDLQTSNANCGQCGTACTGTNQGCAGGSCGAAKTFPTPALCAGGGPQIVTMPSGSAPMCLGLLAQTTFTWGVCSCKNVNFMDDALIDGWNSTVGPYKAGQLGGGVGANGEILGMSNTDIWGQAWAASPTTSFGVSQLEVHYDLQSAGNVNGDAITVTHDAYVGGNISGQMSVGGTLYQTPGKASGGLKAVAQNVTVQQPCDCAHPVPVAATVAWAKTNNDNAAIGLDPAVMTQAHPARIDLPCGHYYMLGFSSGGTIVAHGHVALFIDGNASSSGGSLTMTVADAQSTFDIWISGTITTASAFNLGSTSYPALTRVYVGGTQTLDIQSQLTVGAEIWAGNATVLWESNSDLFGAIFTGDFQVLSTFNLHHDQGVLYAGGGCPGPGGSPGNPGSGSASGASSSGTSSGASTSGTAASSGTGGPAPMCGTCKDCGNQACISGTCGQCTSNAQCCPPLICSGGTCAPVIIR